MGTFDYDDYVFPVVGCNEVSIPAGRTLKIHNVYGTAFSIGNDFFLTAGHVITNAKAETDAIAIAFQAERAYFFIVAEAYEILPDIDIGIIRLSGIDRAKPFKWMLGELQKLRDVFTAGYPYALDLEHRVLNARAYKGHIVSSTSFRMMKAQPRIYELSFPAPRGLSGSPLLAADNEAKIVGSIIGNKSTEMNVFSSKEIIAEDKEMIVERYEALQHGIAIQTESLLTIQSQIIGSSISDHLKKSSLIE